MSDSTATLDAPVTPAAPTTDTPATTTAADDKAASSSPTETPAEQTPAPAIEYSLKLPPESSLDPTVIERTAALARPLGLSNEAAQKALDLVNQEVVSALDAKLEALAPGGAEWTKINDAWTKETLADPTLGATPSERKAAIAKGTAVITRYAATHPADADAFRNFLNESALGNEPRVARFFAWLGKSMDEGKIIPATQPTTTEKSLAEIFYPKGAARTEEEIRRDG